MLVAIGFDEIEWEMPNLRYFWPGDFLTSIRETMATPETSHAAAIDPLTPQPSQPTPSPRLRQRRVRLVLMKLNGKCPIFDAFGQVILKSFFKLALLPSRVLRNESSLHVWGTLT